MKAIITIIDDYGNIVDAQRLIEPTKRCVSEEETEYIFEHRVIQLRNSWLKENTMLSVDEMDRAVQKYCAGHDKDSEWTCEGCEIDDICRLCEGKFGNEGYEAETKAAYLYLVRMGLIGEAQNDT